MILRKIIMNKFDRPKIVKKSDMKKDFINNIAHALLKTLGVDNFQEEENDELGIFEQTNKSN